MIRWNISKQDAGLVEIVVKRTQAEGFAVIDPLKLTMDITACHLSGCPLDLAKLLAFPSFDFVHDVLGIHRLIDRETGKLKNCFTPRCAK